MIITEYKDMTTQRLWRFFSLFLLLLAAVAMQAQKLTVESFGVALGDLDARSSTTQRADRNGTPCALVKVQLPLQGAQFDGVVGDVQFKAGVYWVYMPNGAYLLKISHPQYHQLELNLRTLRPAEDNFRGVEQLTTYNLVIYVPQTEKTQRLVINYTPVNATVLIDSRQRTPSSPGTVGEDLPLGEHSYVVFANGYIASEGTVKLNGGKQRVLPVELEKDDASTGQTVTTASTLPTVPSQTATTTTVQQPAADAPTLTITVGDVQFKMIRVEGGTFTMGATSEQGSDAWDEEKPAHRVTLSTYYMGETEVTQALWQAVMGTNVRQQRDLANPQWPLKGEGSSYPMYYISWDECQKFVSKLNSITGRNFRLPTEAEWEFAARGGNRSQHYKYSGSNDVSSVAWYWDNGGKETHPVKSKQPNELGLYDMSGNVCEWCSDWYGSYSSSPQSTPKGAASGSDRVNRGGSWLNSARSCRVSLRLNFTPGDRSRNLGLRLAL